MNILSLDIASVTGWAVTNDVYGTWNMKTRKDESMGMKLIRFKSKFTEILDLENTEIVLYERPAGRHANSIIHQAKLIAIVEQICEERNIPYRAYSATEIKKYATGKGNAGKPMMVKTAQDRYGMEGSDDNVADALHMLNLFKEENHGV